MKISLRLLLVAVLTMAFSSCCGLWPKTGSLSAQKEITTYKESQRTVYSGKTSYVVTDRVPVTKTKRVWLCCSRCGSSFCPKPQCCGIISPRVIARASAQGSSGEPNIGLVATMKELAPSQQ